MDPSATVFAIAVLSPENNSGVSGVVRLVKQGDKVRVLVEVRGLTDGEHGLHVLEYGNLTQGSASTGTHYNPQKKNHGGPKDAERHVGDLGNITSVGGLARLDTTDSLIQLDGQFHILGRSIVVTQNADDQGKTSHAESKKTGNTGTRLAVGVVALSGPLELN